jgi:hypothetical protein
MSSVCTATTTYRCTSVNAPANAATGTDSITAARTSSTRTMERRLSRIRSTTGPLNSPARSEAYMTTVSSATCAPTSSPNRLHAMIDIAAAHP